MEQNVKKTSTNKSKHLKVLHRDADNQFDCNICNKNFKSKTNLKIHNKTVHEKGAENCVRKWVLF